VLLHFGIHTLDLLLWWLGDLVPLSYADDACGGVEAECESELLQVRDRFPVHLEVSRRRTLRDTTIVRCSGGTIEIGIYEPAVLRLTLAPDAPPLEAQAPDPEFEQAPLRTVFQRQLAEFVAAVVEGRAPLVDADAGGRAVALVDASYALRRPLRRAWDFPDAYRTIPEVGR
jgi:predicted dehydrogenase